MLNVVCLTDGLGRPRIAYNRKSGYCFSIAYPAFQPKGRKNRLIDIVAWRSTLNLLPIFKGSMIVVGSLQTRRYIDRDGNKRTAYEVVADNVFLASQSVTAGEHPRR